MKTLKKAIGYFFVASPFVFLFVGAAMEAGFWNALMFFVGTLFIMLAIAIGVHLIDDK